MRPLLRAVVLAFSLLAGTGVAFLAPAPLALAQSQDAPQFDAAAWERDAAQAETVLSEGRASNRALEQLRERIAGWRKKFTEAQSVNSARIETLRDQIAALGPPPDEGKSEAPAIADRRSALTEQLNQLQAPGIAAAEALGRAEGIIREIDRVIRERQADALLKLSPSPLNPINWPAGAAVLTQGMKTLAAEVSGAWANPTARSEFRNNVPLILFYLLVAALLVIKAPGYIERQTLRLQSLESVRARALIAAGVSLGQIIVPVAGTLLLAAAIVATGMTGLRSSALVNVLPVAAFAFFAARWLGSWLFPDGRGPDDPLALTDRPAEGRFHVSMIGLVLAAEAVRVAFTTEVRPPLSQAAQSVWAAPLVFVVSVFAFRLGMLLRSGFHSDAPTGEAVRFRGQIQYVFATIVVVISVIAPALAAIGYVAAANALIWPAVGSLALLGFLMLLQRFITDIYIVLTRSEEHGREALIPMLTGFALSIFSLPLFALIWGARTTDLGEIWQKFTAGVTIGDTRISPSAFLTFVVIFALGYLLTRLVQGALKTSILPKTRFEKGAQNAIAAGIGYIGIFLSAVVAINQTGINLSSLAIVAGALSVGLGFGLQNIVQNFVSGVILLVERPVSEGDMIEVGGKMGIVRAISVRSTRIETFDRTELIVPNGDLISGVVTNWTRNNQTTRMIVPVGVAYGSDTRKVERILMEIANEQPTVLVDPAPAVVFTGFGADALNFEIRAIVADIGLKLDVQTEINHRIVERFAEEGIVIPFAQRDVWLRNPDAIREGLSGASLDAGRSDPPRPADAATPAEAAPAAHRPNPDPQSIRNDPDEGEDLDRR